MFYRSSSGSVFMVSPTSPRLGVGLVQLGGVTTQREVRILRVANHEALATRVVAESS